MIHMLMYFRGSGRTSAIGKAPPKDDEWIEKQIDG